MTSATSSPAMIALEGLSYRDKMELQLNVDFNGKLTQEIILRDRNKEVISLKFGGEGDNWYSEDNNSLTFGDHKKEIRYGGWRKSKPATNALKVTIQDNLARFYLNDNFWGLQEVTFDTIDKVTVSGIKRDEDFIYSISVTPMD